MRKSAERGLVGRLKGIFGGAARRREPAPTEAPAAPSYTGPVEDEDLLLGLQDFLREEKGNFDRSIHLVSLVEFREAVGEKWQRLGPKVILIARTIIAKHVGPAGTFGQHGEDCFVIAFRGLSLEQERARAIAAANELGQRLLGAQFAAAEQPLALAADVLLSEATGPNGKLDPEILARAVSRVRSLITPEIRLANLHGTQDGEEAGMRRHLQPSAPVPAEPEPAQRPTGPAQVILTSDFAPAEGARVGRTGMLYRPTWVSSQRAIAATLCIVQRQAAPEVPILIGSAVYDHADPGIGLAIDRAVGQAAAMLLTHGMESPLLILPLALNSLVAIRRMHVSGPLSEVPEKLRMSRLMIEIVGIPVGATPSQLADGVAAARKLGRDVAVRAPLLRPFAGVAHDAGASLVGVDLSELGPEEKGEDARLLENLLGFRDRARAAHQATYVWGIRRRPLLADLVHGGFDMLNGPALIKDMSRPGPPIPAPHSRFTKE